MAEGVVTKEVAEAAIDTLAEGAKEAADAGIDMVAGRMFTFGAIAGVVVGGLVTYKILDKKLSLKYEQIAEEEIAQMREHYLKKEKVAEPKPPLKEVVEELGYVAPAVPPVHPGTGVSIPAVENESRLVDETKNVFGNVNYQDVWNYEEELEKRSEDKPYVIHKDEYQQGSFGSGQEHEQATLTYFAEDDVLADERDNIVADIDQTIGLENLEKFGHGSGDANIVYIRNHKMDTDFEIVRSSGSYAAEVHNIQEDDESELKHSDQRRHRSRDGDDD